MLGPRRDPPRKEKLLNPADGSQNWNHNGAECAFDREWNSSWNGTTLSEVLFCVRSRKEIQCLSHEARMCRRQNYVNPSIPKNQKTFFLFLKFPFPLRSRLKRNFFFIKHRTTPRRAAALKQREKERVSNVWLRPTKKSRRVQEMACLGRPIGFTSWSNKENREK